jgi:two-component system, OmpR family, sensor histidine kinase SenX3
MPLTHRRHVRLTSAGGSGTVAQAAGYSDSSNAAAVLATVAAALDTGAVLLDGHEVVLANAAALGLRIVRGGTLTSPMLSRLARTARRTGERTTEDINLPWGAETRAVRATAAPVEGTDQVVLLLADLEEAHRVEAVRRDFVANVSHELKTPVGALMLMAEAVRDNAGDSESVYRFADRMVHESGRLSRLVQELLDLSRLQGGEPLPEPAELKVSDLISTSVDQVRLHVESAGVQVVDGDPGGLTVWGDERSLVTALVNLLDNAIVYSGEGSRVAVGARLRESPDGAEVEISVSDDGIGIPATDLDRIFERFYRVDPARSRETGGTGLGLAIVKHVVGNHGGRVTAWSSAGVGSTFTLHLPVPPGRPDLELPDDEPSDHPKDPDA